VATLFGNGTSPEAARVWDAATGEALTPPLKNKHSLTYNCSFRDILHVMRSD